MSTDAAATEHDLVIEFAGEERLLHPGDELTFGRSADLVIDENRYLHRVLGRFSWTNGMWWLTNTGSATPITMDDRRSPSFLKVAPGASVPVSFEQASVEFEAGGIGYELRVEQLAELPLPDSTVTTGEAEVTTTAASLPLTDEQRLLLVALGEHELRDSASAEGMATNRQIAHKLGWTITKYNRKLDGLCRKYASAGVSGLRGDSGSLARDRRIRLVEHVLHAGIITADDLRLLDEATGNTGTSGTSSDAGA